MWWSLLKQCYQNIIYKYKVFSKYIRKFLRELLFIFIYVWRIIILLCLVRINLCFSASCSIIFVLLNWHCVISRWCSHIDKCCHRQSYLNWLGFTSFFSWDYDNNCGSIVGWFLLQSVFNGHVFFHNYESF
jgi:hypothetical protein